MKNVSYLTIMDSVTAELVEKQSKFLGHMSYVESKEDAEMFISKIRSEYKDATHNVPAYSIYCNGVMYCSDDGEPHGTAGKPILEILKREKIYDVCVVVTRYFGGVLLGTGGLVSAYSDTCKMLIEKAIIARRTLCANLNVVVDYSEFSKIEYFIEKYNANVIEKNFYDKVSMTLLVKSEDEDVFRKLLMEKTAANITIKNIGNSWERVRI